MDKLRELHQDLDREIVPKIAYANYTVRQAAEDRLVNGLVGRSAKTIKKNENVLEPILKDVGARKRAEDPAVPGLPCSRPARARGRSRRLKIAATWPWADVIVTAWDQVSALPQAP